MHGPTKRKERRSAPVKKEKLKRDTHFSHPHPALKSVLIYTFIPVVGIYNGHIIVLKVGRESFVPIQGFSPPIIHNEGGGPLSSGITTGGRGRDEGVGRGRRRHDEMIGVG